MIPLIVGLYRRKVVHCVFCLIFGLLVAHNNFKALASAWPVFFLVNKDLFFVIDMDVDMSGLNFRCQYFLGIALTGLVKRAWGWWMDETSLCRALVHARASLVGGSPVWTRRGYRNTIVPIKL